MRRIPASEIGRVRGKESSLIGRGFLMNQYQMLWCEGHHADKTDLLGSEQSAPYAGHAPTLTSSHRSTSVLCQQ